MFILEALEKNSFPSSAPGAQTHLYSLAHGPFLHLQRPKQHFSDPASTVTCIFPDIPLLPPSSTFKDSCYSTYTHPYTQKNLPTLRLLVTLIPSSTLIPLCQVTWHIYRFQGFRCGHLWGAAILHVKWERGYFRYSGLRRLSLRCDDKRLQAERKGSAKTQWQERTWSGCNTEGKLKTGQITYSLTCLTDTSWCIKRPDTGRELAFI